MTVLRIYLASICKNLGIKAIIQAIGGRTKVNEKRKTFFLYYEESSTAETRTYSSIVYQPSVEVL